MNDEKIEIGGKVELKNNFCVKLIDWKLLASDSNRIISKEDYDIEYDFDDVSASYKDNKVFLLYDQPGMGKSITLEML